MKIAVIIVRTLLGLLFLFASITYFLNLFPQPELTGRVKVFMDGVNATGYLMTFIKITELLCGLAFVTNRFVPLAAVLIAPIAINILLFHAFVSPAELPVAIFVVAANLFLGYANWDKYRPIFVVK